MQNDGSMDVNSFDSLILGLLSRIATLSHTFDVLVVLVSRSDLLKGGVVFASIAWIWHLPGDDRERRRLTLVSTLVASFAALVVARVFAAVLPFRARPAYADLEGFVVPHGVNRVLEDWSSFPSDHASLFCCLAMGTWLAAPQIGRWVMLYTVTLICVPRLYLGLHYPTDVVGGAVIGILMCAVFTAGSVRKRFHPVLNWEASRPAIFYAATFLMAFETANLFDHVRAFGEFAIGTANRIAGTLDG